MKKRFLSLVLATCVFAGALTGCGSKNAGNDNNASAPTKEAVAQDKTTLHLNLASEPKYLDPALNTTVDGGCLAVNSFVGLFMNNEKNEIVPALVDTYEVSDDQLTYTFHLKESKWSDGSDLTAADFEYAWKRAANPKTGADYNYLFDVFAKDENDEIKVKADGLTLTAQVKVPCAYLLDLLAFPTFLPVPKASVEAADKTGTNPGAWCQEAGFVSNGAYTLESWSHNENMVYVKNPNFYDAENVTVEKLEFMLSADQTATYAAYNAGNLDFIDSVPNDETQNVINNDDFYIADQLGTYYFIFNVNADLFKGKTAEEASTLRKALSLLVDRDYIIENIAQTGQKLATSFVPEGMADGNGGIFKSDDYDYPDKETKGYFSGNYDAEEAIATAVELLKGIGYEFDDNNMLSEKTPIAFDYLINEDTGHQAIAEAIQQDWAQIGVDCQISTLEWSTFTQERKAGNFTVARNGWSADFNDPINMLDLWESKSGNNDAQLGKDPSNAAAPEWSKYDELIEKINNETDYAKRTAMLHEAEDMLMDTWAIAPIYYYNDVYMMKNYVSGIYVTPFAMKYFMYAKIA